MATRNWAAHFMARAMLNSNMSTCVSRQVGAVAVKNKRHIADGFNGNLPGALHCDEGGCERCNSTDRTIGLDLLRCVCVHAEQNLVAYCARVGRPLEGATVYTTTYPCVDCLKLLASVGVIETVYRYPYPESLWFPHYEQMLITDVEDKYER